MLIKFLRKVVKLFSLSWQSNKVKAAIDACIQLNQWNMAIDLAKVHNVKVL